MLKLYITLAITVLDFDIDARFGPDSPRARVLGEIAYQTMQAGQLSAYPKDGMPVTVGFRKNGLRNHHET